MQFRVYSNLMKDTIHFGFKGIFVIPNEDVKEDTSTVPANITSKSVKLMEYDEEIVVTREFIYDVMHTEFKGASTYTVSPVLEEVNALFYVVKMHLTAEYPHLMKSGQFRWELKNFIQSLHNGYDSIIIYTGSDKPSWPSKYSEIKTQKMDASGKPMMFSIGYNPMAHVSEAVELSEASKSLPGVLEVAKFPCECYDGETKPVTGQIRNIIMHLNDVHKWKRESIADWLETLDVDLAFKTPE